MPFSYIPERHTNVRVHDSSTLKGAVALFITGSSPRILLFQLFVASIFRIQMGAVGQWDLLLGLAICVYWPFQEWLFHKTLLHAKPRTIFGFTFDSPMAKVHRYHHRNPFNLETIFVPAKVILALIPIHAMIWYLITPTIELALTGIAVFTACAFLYEWIHFFAHIPYRPKSKWLKTIQQNHRAHHFKNEHFWHAFTMPYLDTIMGTGPNPKDTPRSPTCKTLGVDE